MDKIIHLLKHHAYQNIPLNYEEAYFLGEYALQGCRGDERAQIQSTAILCALHTKATYRWQHPSRSQLAHANELPRNAAEQIAGICAAIFREDIGQSEYGFLQPNVPYAMDNCGMGGDLITTANVSTIAAFIAAAGGIPVCKHGSPANADIGRHGSSDFISLLGINTMASKEVVELSIDQENFGYTEALDTRYKLIHQQTHRFAGLPHMNDIIGPITNPLNPRILRRRVMGVNHLVNPWLVAEAYQILNARKLTFMEHAFIVRGLTPRGGVDELSVCSGGSRLVELRSGEIEERSLHAKDFGLKAIDAGMISPHGMSKGEFSEKILKGAITGAPLQMILANSALLFYLAGRSHDLKFCYRLAEEVYESGRAYQKVEAVRRLLPRTV